MGDLDFVDVLVVGGVATVGFTLLSYWFSGVMARRGWSWQVRKAPRRPKAAHDRAAEPAPEGADAPPPPSGRRGV